MNSITIAMPEMGNSLFRKYMKSKYVKSLEREGAAVLWIDLANPEKAACEAAKCSGLLLPGGADVNPAIYGEERSEKCQAPNAIRDGAEPLMLKKFLETGKPVLGICRGVQLMNAALGGTIIQDIKEEQKCRHSSFFSRARFEHLVTVKKDSRLYEIFGTEAVAVNSMHHQAVNKPGKDLVITAVSEDGFTEALELQSYGFCIGVQWHPEHMSAKSEQQRKLFKAFVNECKK